MERQLEFPAASNARTITVLSPTKSGTTADQLVVPDAEPDAPFEVLHWIEATPTLSLAVPLTGIEDAVVLTRVNPGEIIVSEGAVVSALEEGADAGGVVGADPAAPGAGGNPGVAATGLIGVDGVGADGAGAAVTGVVPGDAGGFVGEP